MTIIVWDHRVGKLVADKQATQGDLVRPVTKIRRIRDHLCAASGDWDAAQEMFKWFEDGASADTVPPFLRHKDDWVAFLVVTPDKRVLKYERSPYPMDYTETCEIDGWYAFGSGRDFAIGALAAGVGVVEAVGIANKYCTGCGCGFNVLELEPEKF
jgi:ATP-dependent protease HslVU (ClpYQ) peptidase subunit